MELSPALTGKDKKVPDHHCCDQVSDSSNRCHGGSQAEGETRKALAERTWWGGLGVSERNFPLWVEKGNCISL